MIESVIILLSLAGGFIGLVVAILKLFRLAVGNAIWTQEIEERVKFLEKYTLKDEKNISEDHEN